MSAESQNDPTPVSPEALLSVTVVEYDTRWPSMFEALATQLSAALNDVPVLAIEHVGSTSVPGLMAKPVIDVDVVVAAVDVSSATEALEAVGYRHLGDLGLAGREAFEAPDSNPARHVYVCIDGTLHLRNHLAVRDTLRSRPDLRDAYAAVKQSLLTDPATNIDSYTVGKSNVLQQVLADSDLTDDEKREILHLNAT